MINFANITQLSGLNNSKNRYLFSEHIAWLIIRRGQNEIPNSNIKQTSPKSSLVTSLYEIIILWKLGKSISEFSLFFQKCVINCIWPKLVEFLEFQMVYLVKVHGKIALQMLVFLSVIEVSFSFFFPQWGTKCCLKYF